MNLVDATVTKVLSEPHFKYNNYFITVEYMCYGNVGKTELFFKTQNEALNVKTGYVFQT